MHLKPILLLLVFFLILPPLETAAQIQDSIAVDSAMQALIRQQYEHERKLMERKKNKQIIDLKERQRSAQNRRMFIMIIGVVCCLFFVASFVFLILWLVRKS